MDINCLKNMLKNVASLNKENMELDGMLEPKRVLKERNEILKSVEAIKPRISIFSELLKLAQGSMHNIMIKDAGGFLEASVLFLYDSNTNGIICYPTSYRYSSLENGWKILFTERGITKILSSPRMKGMSDVTKIKLENFIIRIILKGFNLLEEDLYNDTKEDYDRLKTKNKNLKEEAKKYE